ncbi:MAG: ATP-binding cassette domain-containing protein [Deltaproteobacteria bacterium]|nr:ATP-binding cassette domain-containing protein [Deltaproteobacteria bacterium]
MSDTVIQVENISKQYRIGALEGYKTFRETLVDAAKAPFRRIAGVINRQSTIDNRQSETIWALRNVSFEVKQGEVVGIIGRNGAGKSTLLKILSQITEPTEGRVELRGRVGSLLEVGTGFHPELTGHENVYLYGAILGMDRWEVTRKFDEIIAFSELEKFIDTPVKRYSSGMYMRLAFAVAAHLEPEILLVDEVLAVGDVAFQKKCLGKMEDVSREGRTVLFVSHNMQAVKNLCSMGLHLKEGRLLDRGNAHQMVDLYLKSITSASSFSLEQFWEKPEKAPGNERVRLRRIRLIPESEPPDMIITIASSLKISVDYWNMVPQTAIVVNLAFYAIDGSLAFVSLTTNEPTWNGRPFPKGLFRSTCYIPAHLLNEGTYRIRLLFLNESAHHLYDHPEAVVFTVHDTENRGIRWYGRWQGIVRPVLKWTTEQLKNPT